MNLNERLKRDPRLLYRLAFIGALPMLLSPLIECLSELLAPPVNSKFFGTDQRYPATVGLIQTFALTIAVFVWIIFLYRRILSKEPVGKQLRAYLPLSIFLLLVVWLLINVPITGSQAFLTEGSDYRNESTLTFILYFAGYFLFGMLLTTERIRRWFLGTFIAAGTVLGILTLIHVWFAPLPFFHEGILDTLSGIFYNSNHFGYYLTMVVIAAACGAVLGTTRLTRLLCLGSLAVNTAVLILDDTLGCFLAVFATLIVLVVLVYLVFSKQEPEQRKAVRIRVWITAGVFLAISVAMSFFYESLFSSFLKTIFELDQLTDGKDINAGSGRLKMWQHTVRFITEKPVFGHGTEGIGRRLYMLTNFDRPHNEYLQHAAFWGIPFLLVYLGGCICTLLQALRNGFYRSPGVAICFFASLAYMLSAFFGNTMYYTAPFFFLLLGVVASGSHTEVMPVTKPFEMPEGLTKND